MPHVAVRLWDVPGDPGDPGDPGALEWAPISDAAREFVANLKRPYCGAGSGPEVIGWFGERGAQVRSLALVALRREGMAFGLLALGSEEAQRFYPEMGTLYLERIGELAAAALARTLA
ncbi:MAG: DUF484 family protein [Rhodocyclaceae bacterium]|nr:DUF484 family protein [Rhodocyclaceae bacterium]